MPSILTTSRFLRILIQARKKVLIGNCGGQGHAVQPITYGVLVSHRLSFLLFNKLYDAASILPPDTPPHSHLVFTRKITFKSRVNDQFGEIKYDVKLELHIRCVQG